ncbi:MAG: glutathione peroxidase [Flavobacteriales bacterium]
MKLFWTLSALILMSIVTACETTIKTPLEVRTETADLGIYQFEKLERIDGSMMNLNEYRGYKILIVNVASKCGLTPQYKGLQELYDAYQDDKFVIIGFPSNDFMGQEPGTNTEIVQFCSSNYGVTFPMMSKIAVKGEDIHPLYQYLTKKVHNGLEDNSVSWNFQKFLIGRSGKLEKVLSPSTKPSDPELISWIEAN